MIPPWLRGSTLALFIAIGLGAVGVIGLKLEFLSPRVGLMVGLLPFLLLLAWLLPRVWSARDDRYDRPPRGYPWGDANWRAAARAIVLTVIVLTELLVFVALPDSTFDSQQAKDIGFWAIVLPGLIGLGVMFFNWPKFIVPPRFRHQPGLLAEVWLAIYKWSREWWTARRA